MDCNKEEAIRAKDIAEKKMQIKDFVGAKKVMLKAQQLLPDLDNISQILAVCEVHCSFGIKVNGETDWYGILQLEPTADESSIKKQYRKLALLLHPDKNKFAGAEAAFKLIGEAHMTLSDPAKRSIYDMKRKSNIRSVPSRPPSQPSNRTSYVRKQTWVQNNTSYNTTSHVNGINQQQPPPVSSTAQTFWTICPSCGMRYQYYLSILNKPIRCQQCFKPFIAYNLNGEAVPPGVKSGYSSNPSETPKQEFPGQRAHNAGLQNHPGNASSSTGFQGNFGGGSTAAQPSSRSGINTKHCGGSTNRTKEDAKVDVEGGAGNKVKYEEVKLKEVNRREQAVKPSAGNTSRKRGRKNIESSDSDSTDSEEIVIEEDGNPEEQNTGTASSYYPRRSTRQKKNVAYNEDGSEDDEGFVSHPSSKRSRKGGSSCTAGPSFEGETIGVKVQTSEVASDNKIDNNHKGGMSHEENLPNGNKPVTKLGTHDSEPGADEKEVKAKTKASSNADSSVDPSSKTSLDLGSFTYPDPEFYDFEKDKDTSQFAVDQVWAVYDNLDGMPRFYARIRSVNTPRFKLRFTWLEHNPINEAESTWAQEELPVSCGNYRLGKSEFTDDRLMFSHLMFSEKSTRRNSYDIYPRKGEVWALFKGWDITWSSDPGSHRLHEYELVEVLMDFAEGNDISVIPLVRIKGFVCLFMQAIHTRMAPLSIPSGEVLRFSHKVPSYRLTGSERDGVPEGSFELDPASLPTKFEEVFPAVNMDVEPSGFCSKSATSTDKLSTGTVKNSSSLNSKNIQETENTSRGLSPRGVKGLSEIKHHQASEGQHVATGAWNKMESEAMAPKLQVDEKVKIETQSANASNTAEDCCLSPPESTSLVFEYPDSEFHSFIEERSIEKFKRGQIWALYSDVDQYPNFYGLIKKVEPEDCTVHVIWLEACSVKKVAAGWLENHLPTACGTFEVSHDVATFDSTDPFSHLVQAKPSKKKDRYDIWPSINEIWAIFKNWSVGWSRTDLEKCEYDVVEVLEKNVSRVKVVVLTKVSGYRTVFKRESMAVATIEIPMDECLRFSHQIPAFRLTEERGGKLRGCWELDPASVPQTFLFTNSD